jgi:probable HAF family extracellular repeat protein
MNPVYTYSTITLPQSPPDGTRAFITLNAINNSDVVAGSYTYPSTGDGVGNPYGVGVIFDHGKVTQVPAIYGQHSSLQGLNDKGVAVGESGHYQQTARGFVDRNGTYTQINNPTNPASAPTFAAGINNSGEVVGWFDAGNHNSGFTYKNGKFQAFDGPDGGNTFATSVNDRGDIAGYDGGTPEGFIKHANGRMESIQVPGSKMTFIYGINNGGDIVGNFNDAADLNHGFVRLGGQFYEFDVGDQTTIHGINDHGDIVGTSASVLGGGSFIATMGHAPPIGVVAGSVTLDPINASGQPAILGSLHPMIG